MISRRLYGTTILDVACLQALKLGPTKFTRTQTVFNMMSSLCIQSGPRKSTILAASQRQLDLGDDVTRYYCRPSARAEIIRPGYVSRPVFNLYVTSVLCKVAYEGAGHSNQVIGLRRPGPSSRTFVPAHFLELILRLCRQSLGRCRPQLLRCVLVIPNTIDN